MDSHALWQSQSRTHFFFLSLFVVSSSTAQTQTVPAPPPPNFYGPLGSRFNPSIAVVMLVLVAACFIIGFFSVYIRQCTERRMGGGNWNASVNFGRRSRRLTRGLDSSVIESFPTFLYSTVKGLKIRKDALECAVCLNEFEDDETLRLIPICSHVFHPDCIDAWLSSHSTCPVCRANLAPQPDESTIARNTIQLNDSDSESVNQPENDYTGDETRDLESQDVNLINSNTMISQNRPVRSRSTGWRLTRLISRSHSTGHSLVQPGENQERFTLRLPEDVRSQLMNSSVLSRTKSCVAFPRARSSRRGYRSRSLGRSYFNYERFHRSDQWVFNITPSFYSRTGSVRSSKPTVTAGGDDEDLSSDPPRETVIGQAPV